MHQFIQESYKKTLSNLCCDRVAVALCQSFCEITRFERLSAMTLNQCLQHGRHFANNCYDIFFKFLVWPSLLHFRTISQGFTEIKSMTMRMSFMFEN